MRPLAFLMIRASVATGAAPTPMSTLGVRCETGTTLYADPLRGGRLIGSERIYQFSSGASPAIAPQRSRSIAAGIVVNEDGGRWPRLSIDASRIQFNRQLALSNDLIPYILANEAKLASRVTRAPLSAADMAAGYSAGVITAIDGTDLTVGSAEVSAVDIGLDYRFLAGANEFTVTANATWTGRCRIRSNPIAPWQDLATVRWRGNASAS